MPRISANRVISGTWGSVLVDGLDIAEVESLQAKVTYSKENVQMARTMAVDKKILSTEGTGSIGLKHVYSRFGDFAKQIAAGKDVRCTIISRLEDPDAYGAERIALYNVSFDEHTLADWAVGKVGTKTVPFTFTEWEYLSEVTA